MAMPTDATHRNAGGDFFKRNPSDTCWMQWVEGSQVWYEMAFLAEKLNRISMSPGDLNDSRPVPKTPHDATHDDTHGRAYKKGNFNNWLLYNEFSGTWTDIGPLITAEYLIPRNAPAQVFQPSLAPNWDCPPAPEVPFTNYFLEYTFVGSRVTCSPPPLDTDQDVLVLIHEFNRDVMERKMREDGYVREGSNPAELINNADKESVFFSYRKGDMNYIVTTSASFYERFKTATELARKYNLMEKSDRIQLFQAVLYGKWWA